VFIVGPKAQTTLLGMNLCFALQKYLQNLFFPYLGANKEYLLHVIHYIISSLFFNQNLFISRLFQHVMSLKYGNVLCG
jgi:hypothetical protein